MGQYDENAWGAQQKGANSTDYSDVANYTGLASSQCNILPAEWGPGDYWVDVYPKDYLAYCVFTNQTNLTATIPTATAAGARAVGLGHPCPSGVNTPVKVPGGCVYFARIASGTTDVTVTLRSSRRAKV